jgi:hypothetical protein
MNTTKKTAAARTKSPSRKSRTEHARSREEPLAEQTVEARPRIKVSKSERRSKGRKDARPESDGSYGGAGLGGGNKSGKLIELLKRAGGASLAELMDASGWQAHSVRGFLSGAVKKRMDLPIESALDTQGVRRYRLGA